MRFWGIAIQIATLFVGTAFPAFRSVEALESKGSLDDSQWLTYWILMAFMTIFERTLFSVVGKFPLYAELKLVWLAFLALPPVNGAELLYFKARPLVLEVYARIKARLNGVRGEEGAAFIAGGSSNLLDLRNRVRSTCNTIQAVLMKQLAAVAAGKMSEADLIAKTDKLDSLIDREDNVAAADEYYEETKVGVVAPAAETTEPLPATVDNMLS